MTRRQIHRIAHDELIEATTRFQARLRLDDPSVSPRRVALAMEIWLEAMTAVLLSVAQAVQDPGAFMRRTTDAQIAEARTRIRRARETMELADQ